MPDNISVSASDSDLKAQICSGGESAILLPSNQSPENSLEMGLPCVMTGSEVSTFVPKDQVFSGLR